jgi:Uma2 family endonuclease
MLLREKLYTTDEFWEYSKRPENLDRRLELDEGAIVEVAPSKPLNTMVAINVATELRTFLKSHKLGWVTWADGGFELGPKKVRVPDTAFIFRSRAPKVPKRFKVAPELAVEIVSPDEFWEYTALSENEGRRLELVEGVITESAESRPINTVTAGIVIHFLNAFVIPRKFGWVTVPDGGFQLSATKGRQPDVAFVSAARLSTLPEKFKFAPDLAVEVVSPSEDIFSKAEDYLRAGTQQVWAIFPDRHIVYVVSLEMDDTIHSKRLEINDTLDGGSILPGFTLPVRDIFPSTLRTAADEA